MNKSINLLASTQPGVEGPWAHKVCLAATSLLESLDWKVFGPWVYDANGDLKELMAQRAVAAKSGASFTLSVHIDSIGDRRKTGILMIYPADHPEYKKWAGSLGLILGAQTGLGLDKVVDESYTYVKRLGIFRGIPGPNILAEVSEYSTATELTWLQSHIDLVAQSLTMAIDQSAHLIYGTPEGKGDELDMGIKVDDPKGPTADEAYRYLIKKGVIQQGHSLDMATGNRLLMIELARVHQRIDLLETKIK